MDSPLSPAVFEWSLHPSLPAFSESKELNERKHVDVFSSPPDSGSETETEPLPAESSQDAERLAYMSVFTAGAEFVMAVNGEALVFTTCQCALNAAMTQHLQGGARPDLALRFTAKGSMGRAGATARQQLKAFRQMCAAEGVRLDKDAWAAARMPAMLHAMCCKGQADQRFRLAVLSIARRGIRIPMAVRYGRLFKQAAPLLKMHSLVN